MWSFKKKRIPQPGEVWTRKDDLLGPWPTNEGVFIRDVQQGIVRYAFGVEKPRLPQGYSWSDHRATFSISPFYIHIITRRQLMGMFDSLYMDCPNCGHKKSLEFQSKSGECLLNEYTVENIPNEVLAGLHSYGSKCRNCGKIYKPVVKEQQVVKVYTIILMQDKE